GFRDLRTRRLIRDTPTAHIRSMSMGLVEVSGEAQCHSVLQAPFSGRSCAYWEVDIATRSARRNSWSIVHRTASPHPFYVRAAPGLALVDPRGAECKVRAGIEEDCLGVSLPDCYRRYLSDQHPVAAPLWRLSLMRFRERTIEEGQRIFVLGTATPRPCSEA